MTDREANAELTWPDSCSAVHPQLDSTASCSICNDFYDTPLVLPCGHSFCSNCIRSYISHQQGQARCPQCRAVCDERDLRPNTALRDLASQDKQGLNNAGPPSLDSGNNKRQLRNGKTLHPIAETAAVTTIGVLEDSKVKVPAKIAFHLFNDKKLRDKLKDHNLPIHGKRKDLEERYNRLRLEVQLAADKAEAASEAELVRRAMAKEKAMAPVKGFFGAAAKGGLRGSGSGTDAPSDDPDLPDIEYDSFAALIQATKERDAARKARQQKARLADASASASDTIKHTSNGLTSIDNEEQLAAYPAGALSSGGSHPPDAVLPTRGKPPNSSTVMQRGAPQEPAPQYEDSFATSTGRPCLHVKAGKAQDLQSRDDKREQLGCRHAGQHGATKLTSDDLSEGLSQDRLEVDLMDEAGSMPNPAAQDQRALQQLQLLNKSAVPAVINSTSPAKAMVSSHGKGHVLPSSLIYHNSIDQTRNEEALGVLNDIIEDTDSDIEGTAA
ncbi:hypothetical protein WJX79_000884 [Trebouxia sp. C0005]